MSFTYDETAIAVDSTDYISMVRFNVNDTDSTAYDLSDEVITALYNQTATSNAQTIRNYQTAIAAQEYLCSKRANNIQSFSSGGTSVTYSKDDCLAKLSMLRQKLMLNNGQSGVLYPMRRSGFSSNRW